MDRHAGGGLTDGRHVDGGNANDRSADGDPADVRHADAPSDRGGSPRRSREMIQRASVVWLGASLAAILSTTALLAVLWRRRTEAAARSLLGVAAALLVGSLFHFVVTDPGGTAPFVALTGRKPGGLTWVVSGVACTVAASGIWSLFAVQYTGRGRTLRRIVAGTVALLSTAAACAAVHVAAAGPTPLSVQVLTVCYLLAGFLATAGAFVLLWASVGQNAFPILEPLSLSGGVVVLLSGSLIAQVFQRPALFPALVALASVAFLVPMLRYPIFETLPAARVAGRDRVVDELGEGILVTDREGRLRDLNPAAESLLDASREAVLGEPVTALLGPRAAPEAVLGARGPVRVELDGTTLEMTGNRVDDRRNRSFGFTLLCADVTDRRTREEQLTLLGRFVADVVRDRVVTVADVASDAAERPGGSTGGAGDGPVSATDDERAADRTRAADSIWETTTSLARIVARARAVERAIAGEGRRGQVSPDLRTEIETIAGAVGAERGPEVDVDLPDEPFAPDLPRGVFEVVLRTVLEDAFDRSTAIALVARDDPPELTVRGGHPERTAPPADRGTEGPSIDLARLAVELAGGGLSVTTTSGGQRRVTIHLPASAGSAAAAPASDASATGAGGHAERDRGGSATTGTDR